MQWKGRNETQSAKDACQLPTSICVLLGPSDISAARGQAGQEREIEAEDCGCRWMTVLGAR